MKNKRPDEILEILSYIYAFLSIALFLFFIIINFLIFFKSPTIIAMTSEPVLVQVFIYFLYSHLTEKMADGKSKGILLLFLIFLGIINGFYLIIIKKITIFKLCVFIVNVIAFVILLIIKKDKPDDTIKKEM